jgi:exopolysaccharide production protein ExoZ
MKNKSPAEQIVVIDLVRFLAAFAVLLHHLAFTIGARDDSTVHHLSQGVASAPFWPDLTFYGFIGVQVFFVISGIVIAYSANGAGIWQFFRSRFLRLVPAAWICASLTLFAVWWVDGPSAELWREYRHSMLFLPWAPWIDSVYWTLGVEIAFYTLVGLFIRSGRMAQLTTLASVLSLLSLGYWLTITLAHLGGFQVLQPLLDPPYFVSRLLELLLIKHGCYFAAGILICKACVERVGRPRAWLILIMMMTAILEIYWKIQTSPKGDGFSSILPTCVFFGAVLLIIGGIYRNDWFSRHSGLSSLMRTLGLLTYPLYLLHANIGAVIVGRLVNLGVAVLPAIGMASASVILLSYLVVAYLEPWLRRLVARSMDLFRNRILAGQGV